MDGSSARQSARYYYLATDSPIPPSIRYERVVVGLSDRTMCQDSCPVCWAEQFRDVVEQYVDERSELSKGARRTGKKVAKLPD